MTRAPALEHLRARVRTHGLQEQRTSDGVSVLLALSASADDLEAHYDPTRPDAGVCLRSAIGPLPSDPAQRQPLVERMLQINHSLARRFGFSLFLEEKDGENSRICLKSRLGSGALEDAQFTEKLALFAQSVEESRNLLERIMTEKNSKKDTIATDRVRL